MSMNSRSNSALAAAVGATVAAGAAVGAGRDVGVGGGAACWQAERATTASASGTLCQARTATVQIFIASPVGVVAARWPTTPQRSVYYEVDCRMRDRTLETRRRERVQLSGSSQALCAFRGSAS